MVLNAQTKFLGGNRGGGTMTSNFPGKFQHLRDQRRGEKHGPICPQHPRCLASSGSGASLQLFYCCWFIASFKATLRKCNIIRTFAGSQRQLQGSRQSPDLVPWRQPAVGHRGRGSRRGAAAGAASVLSFGRSSANTLTPLWSFTPDMDKKYLRRSLRQRVRALTEEGTAGSLQ